MATITLGLHSSGLAVLIVSVFRIQRFETVRSVGLTSGLKLACRSDAMPLKVSRSAASPSRSPCRGSSVLSMDYQTCLAFRESEMDGWLSPVKHIYVYNIRLASSPAEQWTGLRECILRCPPCHFPLILSFSSVLERARHSIERTLELDAHEEPDYVCQKAPKILPRLVHCLLAAGPAVPQDLPAFRIDQPARGSCEAPRKPEVDVVYMSQDLFRYGRFRPRIIHRGWYVDP